MATPLLASNNIFGNEPSLMKLLLTDLAFKGNRGSAEIDVTQELQPPNLLVGEVIHYIEQSIPCEDNDLVVGKHSIAKQNVM
jgi:hypothetical protein